MNHIPEAPPIECSLKDEVPNGTSRNCIEHYCPRGLQSTDSILQSYTAPSNIIPNVSFEALQSFQALQVSKVSYKAHFLSTTCQLVL